MLPAANPLGDLDAFNQETPVDEAFANAQLRLTALHDKLETYLKAQPATDMRSWQICDRALSSWFDTLRSGFRHFDGRSEDPPVAFFVLQ